MTNIKQKISEVEKEIEELKENMWGTELIRRRNDNGKSWGYDWNGKRISIPREYENKEHFFKRMDNILIEVRILQATLQTLKSCEEEITKLQEKNKAKVEKLTGEIHSAIDMPKTTKEEVKTLEWVWKRIDKIYQEETGEKLTK